MIQGLLLILTVSLVLEPAAFAQAPLALPHPSMEQLSRPESRLVMPSRRNVSSIAATGEMTAPRRDADERPNGERTWIDRHPALFGAVVGAGAGLLAGGTLNNEFICQKGNDEDCLFYTGSRFAVGAGIGAGIGALVGWIAGR